MASGKGLSLTPVLTVGVSGHRRLNDSGSVARRSGTVLDAASEAAAAGYSLSGELLSVGPARVRIVSPLAEGADRVVARAGLDRGLALQCPLPFDRGEYERDFDGEGSRAEFRDLLGRAEAVFELDGRADEREEAYAAVGALVVGHADLLIAVWDGGRSHGHGGTAEVVERALSARTVIVLIDPDHDVPPVLITGTVSRLLREPLERLSERLRPSLHPTAAAGADGMDGMDGLRRLAGERMRLLGLGAVPSIAPEWAGLYDCADRLAGRYALLYRRTFVLNFALSAVAVTAALLSGAQIDKTASPLLLEIACIGTIILLTSLARARAWHQRWIEYRHLAEQLRPLDLLARLGVTIPEWRPSGYARMSDRSSAWVDWLAARAGRALGLRNDRLDPEELQAIRARLNVEIDGQLAYHKRVADRYRHAERRSQSVGTSLFALSGIVCALHLAQLIGGRPLLGWAGLEGPILTILAGALPACGAAALGIRNVGEYARLTRRSAATFDALSEESRHLATLTEPLSSPELAQRMTAAVMNMMTETADWRSIVITRGIELPG